MTDLDPNLRVCAVCGRVADYADGAGYVHLAALMEGIADHPVVPVKPDEVHTVGVCDFCYGPNPGFVLPVRDFIHKGAPKIDFGDGEERDQKSIGAYAACAGCATLIERNDWNGVIRRLKASDPRVNEPEVERALRAMFRQVRANITGGIRPLEWPTPKTH